MSATDAGGPEKQQQPQRISVSLETLRDEIRSGIENALLKLQLELVRTYATKEEAKRLADDLRLVVESTLARQKEMNEKLDGLEKDKAGRDAVTNFKRWLTGGAILATLFMAAQVAISIYLVTRGGGSGP